jgi:hypothetical protein
MRWGLCLLEGLVRVSAKDDGQEPDGFVKQVRLHAHFAMVDAGQDVWAAEKVPYRMFEEMADLGYSDGDTSNILVHGENLDALNSLLAFPPDHLSMN